MLVVYSFFLCFMCLIIVKVILYFYIFWWYVNEFLLFLFYFVIFGNFDFVCVGRDVFWIFCGFS